MISFEKAKKNAVDMYKRQCDLDVCTEFEDSWVFGFKLKDGSPAYCTPVRVFKETGKSVFFPIFRYPEFFKTRLTDTFYL